MGGVLEDGGYKVLEGADYAGALAIHSQYRGKIDVVFTDVSLPGPNGYALVKAPLEIEPDLKAIFVSGQAGAEACRFHGMTTTDVHFMGKPLNASGLLGRARLVLWAGRPFLTRAAM